jgi:hypothetical protein
VNDNEDEERPEPGRMRFQDESTTPREPTLAERRAREQAARRAEEARRAEAEQAAEREATSKRRRKRLLIGAGATVGIVAVIAVGYALAQPDDEVEAQCVDAETGVVVEDDNCVTPVAGGSYGHAGYPIFIGVGGRQYRYNYGGSGAIGQPVAGGTSTLPKEGTTVVTSSGRVVAGGSSSSSGSDTVSRGGLGVSGDGSSSGS